MSLTQHNLALVFSYSTTLSVILHHYVSRCRGDNHVRVDAGRTKLM